MKTHCIRGHEFTKENTLFHKRKDRKSGKTRRCKECTRLDSLRRKAIRLEPFTKNEISLMDRKSNLKHLYGMSLEDYEQILIKQKYKCANPFCHNQYLDIKKLSVDHDHSCCPGRNSCGKCIRGLLCMECNFILGHANDDDSYLNGLVEYLQKWKKYTTTSLSEEMKITKKLKVNQDGLGLDVVNLELMDIKNYSDILLKALPLDQTIFSIEKINI